MDYRLQTLQRLIFFTMFGGVISDHMSPIHRLLVPKSFKSKVQHAGLFSSTLSIPSSLVEIPSRIEEMFSIAYFLEQLLLVDLQVQKSLISP
jgi:hypothetical protein